MKNEEIMFSKLYEMIGESKIASSNQKSISTDILPKMKDNHCKLESFQTSNFKNSIATFEE